MKSTIYCVIINLQYRFSCGDTMTKESDQEWLEKALLSYEQEKSKNPEYLSFDDITIKTFARRIVGQIKEQMKLDNEQCELLLKAIFCNNL